MSRIFLFFWLMSITVLTQAQGLTLSDIGTLYPNSATPSESYIVFDHNILNGTFTVQELNQLKTTQEPNPTAGIVPFTMFQYDQPNNQVYLGGPIGDWFGVQELSGLVTNASQVIATDEVQRFRKMQEVYEDKKQFLENQKQRKRNMQRLFQQLNSLLQQEIDNDQTVQQWIERSLEKQTDPTEPTPTPEPVQEGDMKTDDQGLWVYRNGAWDLFRSANVNVQ